MCLHFNCAFGLFLMLRKSLTLMRNTPLARILPFDQHVMFHKMAGFAVVFFTLIHTAMHLANASMFSFSCSFIPAICGLGEWIRGVMYRVDGGKHFCVHCFCCHDLPLTKSNNKYFVCVCVVVVFVFSLLPPARQKTQPFWDSFHTEGQGGLVLWVRSPVRSYPRCYSAHHVHMFNGVCAPIWMLRGTVILTYPLSTNPFYMNIDSNLFLSNCMSNIDIDVTVFS